MAEGMPQPASDAPAPTSLRGRLPSLSAERVEALRALFAVPLRWPLRDGGALRLRPATRATHAFALDAEGERLALAFAPDTTAVDLPNGLRWSDHAGRARVLAWALAYEPALVLLSEALGAPLVPIADDDAASAAGAEASAEREGLWVGFDAEDAARTLAGEIRLPIAWVSRLCARAERLSADRARWSDLPVPLWLAWPGPKVPALQWRAIRPGDVIVLGTRTRAGRAEARGIGRAWPLARDTGGWRIDGPVQPLPPSQEPPVSSEEAAPSESEASVLADVPVHIDFEIGRTELTLDALGALQPGYVFALPQPVEGASVTIRANGRVAGRGELVAVGDTLGVRLLAWS